MAVDPNSEGEYLLWGWERFFTELSSFLRAAERQMGTANQAFSEDVLECLQTSLLSLSALMNHLRPVTPSSDEQASVHARYSSEIAELIARVRQIVLQWEHYIDEHMMRDAATSYVVPRERVVHAGQPRFVITREQLEHLASMSFSWTQIARMLAVSRMTVYRRCLEYGLLALCP